MGDFLKIAVGFACLYLFPLALIAFFIEGDVLVGSIFLVIAFGLIGVAFPSFFNPGGVGDKETPNLGNQIPEAIMIAEGDADTGKVDLANTGSELKNTCKRCGKVWYLATDELQRLEKALSITSKNLGRMGALGLMSALTNPGIVSEQMGTSSMVAIGPVQQLRKELEEKSRCPECRSKSIERELVDANEKISKKEVPKKKVVKKKSAGSLADELKKLNELKEQGILDEEEFKAAKRKLIET